MKKKNGSANLKSLICQSLRLRYNSKTMKEKTPTPVLVISFAWH
jgi:hypothetical protein